ncbi:hypothetical protein DN555_27450, partial [Enterobacter asburiae]|uniref:hypothetical protein n=1 Tax=Enterobacter asburiae TaxID=61645 RepID=UPI000FEBB1BC
YWYYDRHRSVRLVILVGLAIDQIAQSGLSSLSVIYYSAQLFSLSDFIHKSSTKDKRLYKPVLYVPVSDDVDSRAARQWKVSVQ